MSQLNEAEVDALAAALRDLAAFVVYHRAAAAVPEFSARWHVDEENGMQITLIYNDATPEDITLRLDGIERHEFVLNLEAMGVRLDEPIPDTANAFREIRRAADRDHTGVGR